VRRSESAAHHGGYVAQRDGAAALDVGPTAIQLCNVSAGVSGRL